MKLTVRELTTFSMLGAVMYVSKVIMEMAPNIHLLGVFVIAFTVVYRQKALYPIYVFVFLTGFFSGFAGWWLPYLYIWTILWAVVMFLPKQMPKGVATIVYMLVCALHGFLYGLLYAPLQAILYGLNLDGMKAWIIAGIPWDFMHGVSNFVCGILIMPVIKALKIASKSVDSV